MKYTNKFNLPESIAQAIINDDYNSGKSDITVTQIISPVQQVRLQKQYADQLQEDISENIYALIGKAIHYILEKAENTMPVEKRLFTEINGWKISGQFDRLALITQDGGFSGIIQDYKIVSIWEFIYGLNPERETQLNLLAYLLILNNYKVSKLQIVMIFRDWQKSKAMYDKDYPQQQIGIINVPLWPIEKMEAYLESRIKLFQSENIPECTQEERWNKGDKYAVMKKGGKRALRVFDNSEEAADMVSEGNGDIIEIRKGENKRCENYCNVKDFCPQFKRLVRE
jgi:hypothetical protein